MTRAPLLALGALALVLAATLAVELALPGPGDDDVAAATGIRPAPRLPRLDAARATAQVIDRSDAWVATILARPLFSRDRRPPDAKVASASDPGEGLPRLTGIAVSPAGRSAIFAGAAAGKPIVVGEGGSVGGYTVRAIAPGQVQVVGPGGARTLSPVFDPTLPAVTAEAPRPPGMQGFPGLPLTPGMPLQMPGRPFMPQVPRFGNGAFNQPSRFDAGVPSAYASQQ
jgi:hypothetical protein